MSDLSYKDWSAPLWRGVGLIMLTMAASAQTQGANSDELRPVYTNNFETTQVGTVPADFLVLEGAFAVKEESGNRFLELPGAPLDAFGVLFGPTEGEGFAVQARIYGQGKGRRYPAFAVGLNGVGGIRLQVTPAKRALELYKADELLASAPYEWEAESWTALRLQVRKGKENGFLVEGKSWKASLAEPKEWTISHKLEGELIPGRASIWGSPFAGTPIRYDDIAVFPVK